MSSSPRPTRAPEPAVATPDELSSIRPSSTHTPSAPPGDASRARDAGDKALRLAQKLRIAAIVLADLPPQDSRQRLLHVAMVRRDEVLLDGVLASLKIDPTRHESQPSPALGSENSAANRSGTYEAAVSPSSPPRSEGQGR